MMNSTTFVAPLCLYSQRRKPTSLLHSRTRRTTVASVQNKDEKSPQGVNLFVSDIRRIRSKLEIKEPVSTHQDPHPLRSRLGKNLLSFLAQIQGGIERGVERDMVARQRLMRSLYVPGSALSRLLRGMDTGNASEWRPLAYFEWQRVAAELSPAAARTVQKKQRNRMVGAVAKTTANVVRTSISMSGKAVLAIMDATVSGMRRTRGKRKTKRKQKARFVRTAQAAVLKKGVRKVKRGWNLGGYETRLFFVVAGAVSAKAFISAAAPFAAFASTAYVVSSARAPRALPTKSKLLDAVVKRRSNTLKKVDMFLANRQIQRKLLPPPRNIGPSVKAEPKKQEYTNTVTGKKERDESVNKETSILETRKKHKVSGGENVDKLITKKWDIVTKRNGITERRNKKDIVLTESEVVRTEATVFEAHAEQVGAVAPAVLYTPVVGNVLQGVDSVAYLVETGFGRVQRRIETVFGMERKLEKDTWPVLSVFKWQRENEGR